MTYFLTTSSPVEKAIKSQIEHAKTRSIELDAQCQAVTQFAAEAKAGMQRRKIQLAQARQVLTRCIDSMY
jgi:hypothetical protein